MLHVLVRFPTRAAVAGLALILTSPVALAETPELVSAVENGNRARAIALLESRVDVTMPAADGTTALHYAVLQNDLELVRQLLAAGADPSAVNRYGITPLHLAAVNGSAPLIEQLLAAGADANEAGPEGETALMTAARTGVVAAADVLLKHGAAVDAREDWHGQTALMWAAAEGHPAMLQRLIDAGAAVDAVSNEVEWERQNSDEPRAKWLPPGGLTALLFAAREACLACIPVLAAGGANLDATTAEDISAVVLALINEHRAARSYIVDLSGARQIGVGLRKHDAENTLGCLDEEAPNLVGPWITRVAVTRHISSVELQRLES
jgi:ankyrin repeat protein